MSKTKLVVVLAVLAFLAPFSGPGAVAAPDDPSLVVTPGSARTLSKKLVTPWSLAFRGKTGFISERNTGRILEVLPGGKTRLVGTVPDIFFKSEAGLLGLAFDSEGRLYAYSTATTGNRIQRFTLSGRPGTFKLGEGVTLISGIPHNSYHNGGRLAFGPDGMLYATTGDAGQQDLAQDPNSLAGKILRMTPDGKPASGNPFPGSVVWSLGHRNPEGIGWSADGRMWSSELGFETWDELNIIEPGSNYGWPIVEGKTTDPRFVSPVQQWEVSTASPSGLAVVGDTIFIANLRGQVLRAVPIDDPGTSTEYFSGVFGRLRNVTLGPDGRVWLLTTNTDGRAPAHAFDDRLIYFKVS